MVSVRKGAGGRVSLTLAGSVLLAMFAGRVAADECRDFRAALAIESAAHEEMLGLVPGSADFDSATTMARMAERAIDHAAGAIRRNVANETVATTIDALISARNELLVAWELTEDWSEKHTLVWNKQMSTKEAKIARAFRRMNSRFVDATSAIRTIYREALEVACLARGLSSSE